MNFWVEFFCKAGIPAVTSKRYARLFTENRMTFQHLRHLDKDLLKEMGVNAIGDIINILQHIKSIDADKFTDEQNTVLVSSKTTISPMSNIPPGHELPVPMKRRVSKEIEGSYIVKLPEGKTEKTRKILRKLAAATNGAVKSSETFRTVVVTSTPSVTADLEFDKSDDDSDNVEVTLSGFKGDEVNTINGINVPSSRSRTSNFGGNRPSRSTVFDRLGAEVSPTATKSVLARTVDRALASHTAREARVRGQSEATVAAATTKPGCLKRLTSDSIFSRLGARRPFDDTTREEVGLPYLGVLKRPRLQRQQPQLSPPLTPSPAPSSGVRVSAKSRLGLSLGNPNSILGRSAGIFASETSKTNVRQRLGKL